MRIRDRFSKLDSHWLIGLIGLVCLGLYWQKSTEWVALPQLKSIASGIISALKPAVQKSIADVWLNPLFYGLSAAILIIERRFPVQPKQKTFSIGLLQDSIWLLGDFVIKYCLLIYYVRGLNWVFAQSVGSWRLNLPQLLHLPSWVTFVLAIVVSDFLSWFAHFALHQHPFLWRFHAIHHSQRDLNFLTDLRFHAGEALFTFPILILPMYFFMIPLPYQGYYLLFRTWYARLYHASIRSNFGWLRYILVTPQSHRVHHSIEPRQYNQNYGVIFSVWDFWFRTQYKHYDDYPQTGIDDPHFPTEQKFNLSSALKTYWAQQLYPFGWKN